MMRARNNVVLVTVSLVVACGEPVVAKVETTLQSQIDALTLESALVSPASLGPALGVSVSLCEFDAASRFFECPGRSFNGFTYQQRFQLRAESGATLDSYEADAVASIRLLTVGIGTAQVVGVPTNKSSYELHRDRTLSGLLAGARILRGRDSSVLAQPVAGGTQTDVVTHTGTNLVLPPNAGESPLWPESGVETIALLRTTTGVATPYSNLMILTYTGSDTARVTQFTSTAADPTDCTFIRPGGETPGGLDCSQGRVLRPISLSPHPR
jgi:hypothetical protein